MIRAGSALVRQLQREFKPGYHLRSAGNARHAVYGPDGEPVRTATGIPLLLPNSPHSSGHVPEQLRQRLRAAGVID